MPDNVPYQSITLVIPAGLNRRIVGKFASLAVLSATYADDVAISYNGQSFFNLPSGVGLDFEEEGEFYIKNTNASANTVVVATGTAKINDRRVLNVTGISAADGAISTLGAKADAAASTDGATASLIAHLKRLNGKFGALIKTAFTLDSAATTNATLLASGARQVYSVDVFNASAGPLYLRLYDKATAPTVGTDIAKRVYAIPTLTNQHLVWGYGDPYTLGLGLATTALAAYNDATAVAAHDLQITVNYE